MVEDAFDQYAVVDDDRGDAACDRKRILPAGRCSYEYIGRLSGIWGDADNRCGASPFASFIEGCGICFKVMANPYFRGRQYENNGSVLHQIFKDAWVFCNQ